MHLISVMEGPASMGSFFVFPSTFSLLLVFFSLLWFPSHVEVMQAICAIMVG